MTGNPDISEKRPKKTNASKIDRTVLLITNHLEDCVTSTTLWFTKYCRVVNGQRLYDKLMQICNVNYYSIC